MDYVVIKVAAILSLWELFVDLRLQTLQLWSCTPMISSSRHLHHHRAHMELRIYLNLKLMKHEIIAAGWQQMASNGHGIPPVEGSSRSIANVMFFTRNVLTCNVFLICILQGTGIYPTILAEGFATTIAIQQPGTQVKTSTDLDIMRGMLIGAPSEQI
jgi:hypothetical protein